MQKPPLSLRAYNTPEPTPPVGASLSFSFQSSRWWGLLTGNLARLLFPKRILLDNDGIQTSMTRSLIFPWQKEDELMTFRRVSSIRRLKGLFWDALIIETAGKNRLDIEGLPKPHADVLLAALNKKMAESE